MSPSLGEAEALLLREARLLDEARWEEWLALFTEDAVYWVPATPDQPNPHEFVSLIYDDRRLLETRVRRLGNPHLHAHIPPARASRMIANVTIEERAPDMVATRAKLVMVEYRANAQRLFAGTCRHRLVAHGGALKIAAKRVDLVNCDAELEGLVLPF